MATRSVVRRDRKNHSNLRPKHKHTKNYLQHYWPYLPLVTMVLVGLWMVRPASLRTTHKSVLAYATNITNQKLLDDTNQARQKNDVDPLKLNSQLNEAAQAKAQDMVSKNYWSHNTPDGSPPWIFVVNAGYQYQKAGENLAYGFMNSSDTLTGWMNSPSHRQNVLDKDFIDVGFGTATSPNFNNSGPVTIIVAMYGRSITETPFVQLVSEESSTESSYNSQQEASTPAQTKSVSRVEAISGSALPWITSAISFILGVALTLFIVKHALAAKKALRKGEQFVVNHPVLDVVLVGIILVSLIATQQVGTIL